MLKPTSNKLQRVLNAAARVVSGTHKFDRGLSRLLHTELHWLDVPERVVYKLGIMVFNCLHGQAPQYLVELCQPVASVASRKPLRFATSSAPMADGLSVWLVRRSEFPAGQLAGSGYLRKLFQTIYQDVFVRIQRIRSFTIMCYINRLFTYLLTYLLAYLLTYDSTDLITDKTSGTTARW